MAPRKSTKRNKSEEVTRAALSVEELASHHSAVREMLKPEFVTAPDSATLDIRVALQAILRNQQMTSAQIDAQNAELAKLKAQMAKADKAMAKYQEGREKYVEDVWSKADKLKLTGPKRDELIARELKKYDKLKTNIAASRATDQLQFHAVVNRQKKVIVVSAGKLVIQSRGGQQSPVLEPEIIRIKDMQWVLQPGVPTEVPLIVAQLLEQKKRSRQETDARKAILDVNNGRKARQDTEVAAEMSRINREFGTPTEGFPIASRA